MNVNWPSFVSGLVAGAALALITGFMRAAGGDLWALLKRRLNPAPPEPVKVDGRFEPIRYEPGSCAWVREGKLYDYEQKNYAYYPHPKGGARCYREAWVGPQKHIEFLMVRPDAVLKR